MKHSPHDIAPLWAVLAVFAGGGLGSLCRWLGSQISVALEKNAQCETWCWQMLDGGGVNADTWILNLVSVLLLAFLTGRLATTTHRKRSQALKLLLGTGFCGGLGTYGGPVWQVIGRHGFDPLYLSELIALFVVAIPVGLLGLWLGSRQAALSNPTSTPSSSEEAS